MIKVIFIPGNGGGTPKDNWFPYLKRELIKLGVEVTDKDFPDNVLAPEKSWIPFLRELGTDENTILIGHSTGAIAAMRFAEDNKILGSVLVGVYHTDLGIEEEKQAGYFDRLWNWEKIKKNQKWIAQFNSTDDPWIPIEEARFINEKLKTDYFEYTNQGHFGGDYFKEEFPEIVEVTKNHLKKGSS
jgi:predicted alpha/beta hydrolase family esterase